MAEIYQLPEGNGNGNSGFGNIPFSIPIGGFGGGLFGNGGYGMNGIADLFGLAIIASMFGWNGVDWDGEDAAYLTGHIVKQLVERVGEPCYD